MPTVQVPLYLDNRYVRRDFAFREGHELPVPLAEFDRAGGFFLRAPAGVKSPGALWVIMGIRVPVPCVTTTLWYNGRRIVTLAPAGTATYWLPIEVQVSEGLTIRIEQDFGNHAPYTPGTHTLTLAGYFVRDDLLAPPPTTKLADAD